jgi:hypothetical protein
LRSTSKVLLDVRELLAERGDAIVDFGHAARLRENRTGPTSSPAVAEGDDIQRIGARTGRDFDSHVEFSRFPGEIDTR